MFVIYIYSRNGELLSCMVLYLHHGRKERDDKFLSVYMVLQQTTTLFTDTAVRTSNMSQRLRMPQVSFPQYVRYFLVPTFSEFF